MATTIFTADDGIHGRELWRTDGTAAGTALVVDLTPGAAGSTFPDTFTSVPGNVFFVYDDGTHGKELWATDGTADGTRLVADIDPGSSGSSPSQLTSVNGKLFFSADDGSGSGQQAWVSDGTAAGTFALTPSGSSPSAQDPVLYTAFDGKTFFAANGGLYYPGSSSQSGGAGQIWVSDGTQAGTQLFTTIAPASTTTTVSFIQALGSKLVIGAADEGTGGTGSITVSDGTAAGTATFTLSAPDGSRVLAGDAASAGSDVYFVADVYSGGSQTATPQIWMTDGTQAGTHAAGDGQFGGSSVSSLYAVGNKVVFFVDAGSGVSQLWEADPTGTHQLLSGLGFNGATDERSNFKAFGDQLVFSTLNGYFITDGTAAGTHSIDPPNTTLFYNSGSGFNQAAPGSISTSSNNILLDLSDYTSGIELFGSDGTAAGTHLIDDIDPTENHAYPIASPGGSRFPDATSDGLIFVGNDPSTGDEPWVSDGTLAGTHRLADLTPGPDGTSQRIPFLSSGFDFTPYGGGVLFVDGWKLFRADNDRLDGVSLVKAFQVNLNYVPTALTAFGGKVYFAADDGVSGQELWSTDGTADGTQLVVDLSPGSHTEQGRSVPNSSDPTGLTVVGSHLVFTTSSGLWMSDGTAAGTQEIRQGSYTELGQLGGKLLLKGFDRTVQPDGSVTDSNTQVYVTDGTAAGTQPILTSQYYLGSDSNIQFTIGSRVVFDFNDGTSGDELWSTAGTSAGTQLLADISPGGASTNFGGEAADGLGHELFTASPGGDDLNYQLWQTDGTAAGTVLLNDSFGAGNFTVWNGSLYYAGVDGSVGLYKADLTGHNAVEISTETIGELEAGTDRLFFYGSDGANGAELWSTDGTAAGTTRLTDSYTPNSSKPANLTTLLPAAGAVPLSASATLADDTGVSNADGITSDPRIAGHVDAGASVTVTDETGAVLDQFTASDTTYAFTPTTLANGAHTLTVAESLAGQSATATVGLTLDTALPAVSSPRLDAAAGSAARSIGLAAPSDNLTPSGNLAIVAGTLPSDGTVALADGTAVTVGENLTSAQLTGLTFTPGAGAGDASSMFTYTVADLAGNDSTGTATLVVGPRAPTGLAQKGTATGGGPIEVTGQTADAAGDTITLYANGGASPVGSGTVTSGGGFDIITTSTFDAGTVSLTATDTGIDGLTSGPSSPLAATVTGPGGTMPTPVTITAPASGSTLSIIDPTIAGTAGASEAGTTVTLTSGDMLLGSTTVNGDGSWSDRVTFGGDGAYAVTATDTAGGTVVGSATDTFTIDSFPNRDLFGEVTHDVTSPGGDITALYQAILGRAPDATGLENYVAAEQGGTPLATLAASFLASFEYTADYGPLAQESDDAFISQLYENGLHRSPEPAGLSFWEDALEERGFSRAQVAADIATSQESHDDLAPLFAAGVFVPDTSDSAVAHLYDGLLGRSPDAGGLQHYEQLVHSGSWTIPQVTQDILSSPEYETTAVGQDNIQFIGELYQTGFGRAADADGLQHYESALDTGSMTRADVVADFLTSTEFMTDTATADDASYINKVYTVALGRQAEPAGLMYWENALATGTSRSQFDQEAVNSTEFGAHVTTPSQALFVDTLYEGALGRPAEPAGLQHYEDILSSGASFGGLTAATGVAASITQSLEAQQHLAPKVEVGFQIA